MSLLTILIIGFKDNLAPLNVVCHYVVFLGSFLFSVPLFILVQRVSGPFDHVFMGSCR